MQKIQVKNDNLLKPNYFIEYRLKYQDMICFKILFRNRILLWIRNKIKTKYWWYLICLKIEFFDFYDFFKVFFLCQSKNLRGWSEAHQCLICPEHGGLKNWIIQSIRILKTSLFSLQVQKIYFFSSKSFNQKQFFEINNHGN